VRRIALAFAVLALLPATAAADAPQRWKPHVDEASAYAVKRLGQVSFAVRTEKRFWAFEPDRVVPSASVIKAMFMVAYLNRAHVRDRPLSSGRRELLSKMIRRSDNNAATTIRNIVGDAALVRLAHRTHMTRFATAPIWGLSHVTARDQSRFFLKIETLIPERHRATAMTLLRTIVPEQRWGVARARPSHWKLYFKGGWGSGTGAVDHQVAQLRRGDLRVALAIMTTGNPSHKYGKATLEGVAKRLLKGLNAVNPRG
jgi:Beta-lactamase enzyme family